MQEEQPKTNQKKEWYKHGWGLAVAILFFPYFLVWYAWAKSNWSQNVKIAVTVIVAVVMLPFIIAFAAIDTTTQQTANTNNEQPEVSQQQKNDDKPKPKNEKSLEDKVQEALDELGEETKSSLASTSDGGYQGDIIGVESGAGSDTVKVRVSTYFEDSGDENEGGKNIARKIFNMVCMEVPELNSLYVVSDSTGLESRSMYRSDVSFCK
jgi:hypothetical protein